MSNGAYVEFIDCTSLSISFDIYGIATVSYVIVANTPGIKAYETINAGGQVFTGYVTSIYMNRIPKTSWYENHVTLVATTE